MQKFFTNEQNKLKDLFADLNLTLAKFNNKEHDAVRFIMQTLNKGITTFEELGNTVKQTEVQMLVSELQTAQKGINPVTFQKQTTGRLELLNTIAFKVLQQFQYILANWYEQNILKLNQAKDLVTQIITAAIQSGLITGDEIKKYKSPKDAEKYCAKITTDPNIALGEKRALLIVSKFDCLLLFDEMISGLK